jgi:hypothetical protein
MNDRRNPAQPSRARTLDAAAGQPRNYCNRDGDPLPDEERGNAIEAARKSVARWLEREGEDERQSEQPIT